MLNEALDQPPNRVRTSDWPLAVSRDRFQSLRIPGNQQSTRNQKKDAAPDGERSIRVGRPARVRAAGSTTCFAHPGQAFATARPKIFEPGVAARRRGAATETIGSQSGGQTHSRVGP